MRSKYIYGEGREILSAFSALLKGKAPNAREKEQFSKFSRDHIIVHTWLCRDHILVHTSPCWDHIIALAGTTY